MCALQSIAEHVLTFFKRKRSFLHRFVFSKQSWTRAHLFKTKKTIFARMCAFQSKTEDVLIFFKRKRRFLDRCVFFKAKLKACTPFSKEKNTLFAQLGASLGKDGHVATFFKRKSKIFNEKQFDTDVSNWSVWPATADAVFTGWDNSKIFYQHQAKNHAKDVWSFPVVRSAEFVEITGDVFSNVFTEISCVCAKRLENLFDLHIFGALMLGFECEPKINRSISKMAVICYFSSPEDLIRWNEVTFITITLLTNNK